LSVLIIAGVEILDVDKQPIHDEYFTWPWEFVKAWREDKGTVDEYDLFIVYVKHPEHGLEEYTFEVDEANGLMEHFTSLVQQLPEFLICYTSEVNASTITLY
jgi:hypothetical protein